MDKHREELDKLYYETILTDDAARRLAAMPKEERLPFYRQNKAVKGKSATVDEAEAIMKLLTPAK